MVEVMCRLVDGDFMEPAELRPDQLRYWSKHFKECKGSDRRKAEAFLEYGCVQYVGHDFEFDEEQVFIVLPLNGSSEYSEPMPGGLRVWQKKPYMTLNDKDELVPTFYNKSAYKIVKVDKDLFACNCQGWQMRNKRQPVREAEAGCSHVLALYGAFRMRLFGGRNGQNY